MATIKIQFTLFSAFYSPLISTMSGGFLAEEGLEPDWSVSPPGKSVIEEVPSLAEGDLAGRYPECAVVRLELNDGRTFEDFLGEPTGMPGNPMSDETLEEKFRACAGSVGLPSKEIERILATFWNIELYDDVSRLFGETGI